LNWKVILLAFKRLVVAEPFFPAYVEEKVIENNAENG